MPMTQSYIYINLDKSKIIIFKKGGGKTCKNEKWYFKENWIEIVQN